MNTRAQTKQLYPNLNNHERRHVSILHRRLSFLRTKLSSGDHSEGAKDYIAAEISALEWALKITTSIEGETR